MKKTLSLLGLLFVLCGLLTSCDSFMQAGEVKKQLEEMIAYANAPSYKITIEYNPDEGAVRAPALGETHKKVTDVFDLKFEPAKDHVFYKWEASSVDLPAGDKIEDYIELENPLLSGTRATFKKELTNIVIKASAPGLPYTDITITGSKGKFSPSKGTYACIDTYTYPISFDPDQDYEFICWEIYDRNNDGFTGIIENGTYIEIDDIYSAETSYKLIAVPQDPDLSLGIRPVIVERPHVLSYTPLFGVEKPAESPIQVIFDRDMDVNSIYYTDPEKDVMNADTIPGFKTFKCSDTTGKAYGYTKLVGGKLLTCFKNITITDENGNNLLDKFNEPVFETSRILSIVPKKDALDEWTQIHVTLDKDFYYEENDKPITMPMSQKWVYMVTNIKDIEKPSVSKKSLTINNKPISNTSQTFRTKKLRKVNVDLTVFDSGSGPKNSFEIEIVKTSDSKKISKEVNFENLTSQSANFKGELDLFTFMGDKNELLSDTGLIAGNYKIEITINDRAGNKFLDKSSYAFDVSTAAPPVPSAIYCVKKESDAVKVAWVPVDKDDIANYYISYSGEYEDNSPFEETDIELSKYDYTYLIEGEKNIASLNVSINTKDGEDTDSDTTTSDVFAEPVPELNFFMPIEDIFSISGRGTVATGIIERGIINISDTVRIIGNEYTKDTVITGVEINNQMFDSAAAGQSVGLLLRGVSKDDLSRGMFIIKPGVLQVHKKFKAYIYKKTKDEGGAQVPFLSGKNWLFYLYTTSFNGYMTFEGDTILPGQDRIVEVELGENVPLFAGEDFSIRAGGRTVGTGTILEIIE